MSGFRGLELRDGRSDALRDAGSDSLARLGLSQSSRTVPFSSVFLPRPRALRFPAQCQRNLPGARKHTSSIVLHVSIRSSSGQESIARFFIRRSRAVMGLVPTDPRRISCIRGSLNSSESGDDIDDACDSSNAGVTVTSIEFFGTIGVPNSLEVLLP